MRKLINQFDDCICFASSSEESVKEENRAPVSSFRLERALSVNTERESPRLLIKNHSSVNHNDTPEFPSQMMEWDKRNKLTKRSDYSIVRCF